MVFVPTNQVLSRAEDILLCLSPMLSDISLDVNGYKKSRLEGMLQEAFEKGKEPSKKARFERYILNNQLIFDAILSRAMDKYEFPIFQTSVSPDMTDDQRYIPGKIGTDEMPDSFRLSRRKLEEAQGLPEAYEKIAFTLISPVLFSTTIVKDDEEVKLVHTHPNIFRQIHEAMEEKGKRGMGAIEKTLESRGLPATYKFSVEAFDFEKFKYNILRNRGMFEQAIEEFGDLEKALEHKKYEIRLNKLLMVNAYSRIAKAMDLPVIYLFSMKTSYAAQIMEEVSERTGIPLHYIGGDSLFPKERKAITSAECHDSAISALHGFVKSIYDFRRKSISSVDFKVKEKVERPSIEVLSCPYVPFLLCHQQKNCDAVMPVKFCNMKYYRSLPKDMQESIANYCNEKRVALHEGIESVIAELFSGKDFHVVEHGFVHPWSWRDEIEGFRPRIVFIQSDPEYKELGDLRSSALNLIKPGKGACSMAMYISMVKDRFPVEFEPEHYTKEGVAMHELMFMQPVDEHGNPRPLLANEILVKMGMTDSPLPRQTLLDPQQKIYEGYCEIFLQDRNNGYSVPGKPDAFILLERGDEKRLIVPDGKRAMRLPYMRYGYRLQLLKYGINVSKRMGIEPSVIYPVTINSPFIKPRENGKQPQLGMLNQEGMYKKQELTIMRVAKGDPLFMELEEQIAHYASIKGFRTSNDELLQLKRESLAKGLCAGCFPTTKQYCDWSLQETARTGKPMDNLLEIKA